MISLVAFSSLSEDEAEAAIVEALPEGWVFESQQEFDQFYVSLSSPSWNWGRVSDDKHELLIEAYSYLVPDSHIERGINWSSVKERERRYVNPKSNAVDPGDLDPTDIAAVYANLVRE